MLGMFQAGRQCPSGRSDPNDRQADGINAGYVWRVSGGPAMIRAAAKNHEDVAVVVDPADYQDLLASLRGGEGRADFYLRLAWKAFQHTAGYDALVSEWFWGQIGLSRSIQGFSVLCVVKWPCQYIYILRFTMGTSFGLIIAYDVLVSEWFWGQTGACCSLQVLTCAVRGEVAI